jgi:hypothetical protein
MLVAPADGSYATPGLGKSARTRSTSPTSSSGKLRRAMDIFAAAVAAYQGHLRAKR